MPSINILSIFLSEIIVSLGWLDKSFVSLQGTVVRDGRTNFDNIMPRLDLQLIALKNF